MKMCLILACTLAAAQTELFFPWVTHNQQYESIVVFNNLGESAADLMLEARRANGESAQATHRIEAGDQWVVMSDTLLPDLASGPGFVIRATSDRSDITGAYVVRLRSDSGSGSPSQANVVDRQQSGMELIYNYLPVDGEGGNAAPVIVNIGEQTAHVTLRALRDGLELAQSEIAVEPGRPYADLVSNLFPSMTGSMMVTAESDQPILGLAFIFNAASEPSMANAVPLDGPVLAPAPAEGGTWVKKASLPRAVSEMPHAVLDGVLYVCGGGESGSTTDQVQAYYPEEDRWELKAPMPGWRHHLMTMSAGGLLYAMGGYISFPNPEGSVYAYDPATDSWGTLEPLPHRRAAAAGVTCLGKIYLMGGIVVGPSDTVDVFDPMTQQWSTAAPMILPREHLAAAVVDDKIYVVGGRHDFNLGSIDNAEVYDPQTDSWHALPPLPTARSGLAAAGYGGKLYVFGGEAPGIYDEVEAFDPATGLWQAMTPMPVPLHGIGAGTSGRGIYLFGGGSVAGRWKPTDEGYVYYPPN